MKTHDCRAIRREIDEANLDAGLTLEASEHLGQCDECRRFHNDRRTLRTLMADLETVSAPADFDFRLRARLARERSSNGSHGLLLNARAIAALALVVLIAVVAVVLKRGMSPVGNPPPVIANTAPKESGPSESAVKRETPAAAVAPIKDDSRQGVARAGDSQRVPVTRHNAGKQENVAVQKMVNTTSGNAGRSSTRELAGTGAAFITPESFGTLVVVPIDARAFKLSVDNGRGGARTISLPPVSFGSQRLLAREASFVPASSARGDW